MDVVGSVKRRLDAVHQAVSRPLVMDTMIVLIAFALGRGHDHFDITGPRARWDWAFDLALIVPLLWRRRRPTVVFLVISAVALIQWQVDTLAGGDLAILLALYAVGAYERRRRLIALAMVIAELGVLLAELRWVPSDHRLTSGVLFSGTVTAALVLGVYRRTRRDYLASVLERAATAEHERDQQSLIAVADERARISREMHDIVAHSLSVMIALSDGAAVSVARDPQAARQAMEQSSALGRQALGDVRRLLGDQVPAGGLAPQPGIAQLDDLIAQVRAAGLDVDLVIDGRPLVLPPGAQLAIYRTVQEALTNVLKHAHAATRATVTLRYGRADVDIEVQNDDSTDVVVPGRLPVSSTVGRGLAGMRERAAVFNGTVEAAPRHDGGWRVAAHFRLEGSAGQ